VAEAMQIGPPLSEAYCEDLELELLAAPDSNAVIDRWAQSGTDKLMELSNHE